MRHRDQKGAALCQLPLLSEDYALMMRTSATSIESCEMGRCCVDHVQLMSCPGWLTWR